MGWQDGGHDGCAQTRLRKRQQCVWRPAFEPDVRLELGYAASGIEGLPNSEAPVQQEERA